MDFDKIERLVDRLYDKDPELCNALGYASGFQIPIDQDGREDLIADLEDALAYLHFVAKPFNER